MTGRAWLRMLGAIAVAALAAPAGATAATVNGCVIEPGTQCPGKDLSGADLQGADLRGANLSRANLTAANLREAKLRGADLSHARLDSARLDGSNFADAKLDGASLSATSLDKAVGHNAKFTGAVLTEADLTGADLSGASFGQARLSRVRGHGANLSRARFGKAVFVGNHFDGANFNLANFTDFSDSASRLPGATFHGASIGDSKLSGTVLSGADLRGATLELVTTQNLQADGISLRNGYVIGSTFRGGTMRGSDFGGTRVLAKPQHSDLDHAISIQTDFIDVDLSQASFGNTDVAATTLFQRSTIAHVRTAGSTILTTPALRDQFFDYTHARIASTDGCALLEGGEHVICEGHNVSTAATPPFQHNGRFTWRSVAPEGHRDMGIWGGEHKLTGKASHDFKTFKVEVTPNFEHVTGTGDGGQPGEAGGPLALDLKRWQQPDGNLGYELAFHGWLLRKQVPAVRWLG